MREKASQNTLWYGVGNALKELGPAAWEERVRNILKGSIVPNVSPTWQRRLEMHTDTIAKTYGWIATAVEVGIVAGVTYGGYRGIKKVVEKTSLPKVAAALVASTSASVALSPDRTHARVAQGLLREKDRQQKKRLKEGQKKSTIRSRTNKMMEIVRDEATRYSKKKDIIHTLRDARVNALYQSKIRAEVAKAFGGHTDLRLGWITTLVDTARQLVRTDYQIERSARHLQSIPTDDSREAKLSQHFWVTHMLRRAFDSLPPKQQKLMERRLGRWEHPAANIATELVYNHRLVGVHYVTEAVKAI